MREEGLVLRAADGDFDPGAQGAGFDMRTAIFSCGPSISARADRSQRSGASPLAGEALGLFPSFASKVEQIPAGQPQNRKGREREIHERMTPSLSHKNTGGLRCRSTIFSEPVLRLG